MLKLRKTVTPETGDPREADRNAPARHPDSPWVRAEQESDDRYFRLAAQARNWRRAFFVSGLTTFLAVAGIVYIGAQSKLVPYVVEVDKLGVTLGIKPLSNDDRLVDTRKVVYREMLELIPNCRSVSSDIAVNNSRLGQCFSRLETASANYVRGELRKAPPNEVGQTKTVSVQMTLALPLTGAENAWRLEWEEQSYTLEGKKMGEPKHFVGTARYEILHPEKDSDLTDNPSGFHTAELSWVERL